MHPGPSLIFNKIIYNHVGGLVFAFFNYWGPTDYVYKICLSLVQGPRFSFYDPTPPLYFGRLVFKLLYFSGPTDYVYKIWLSLLKWRRFVFFDPNSILNQLRSRLNPGRTEKIHLFKISTINGLTICLRLKIWSRPRPQPETFFGGGGRVDIHQGVLGFQEYGQTPWSRRHDICDAQVAFLSQNFFYNIFKRKKKQEK